MAGEEVIRNISESFFSGYSEFLSTLPTFAQGFVNLFLIVLLVVVYAIFIWKFYRFIARKNLVELNLSQYNKSSTKFFGGVLYLLEYIVILPFLIFFWFTVFTIFLIFLTEDIGINILLIISATIIAAIRMTSYYNEDLSKDLAKLLPFTMLAVSFLNPGFFSIERVLSNFAELPNFFGDIFTYLMFIIILEVILRFFDFVFSLLGIGDEEDRKSRKAEG